MFNQIMSGQNLILHLGKCKLPIHKGRNLALFIRPYSTVPSQKQSLAMSMDSQLMNERIKYITEKRRSRSL